MKTKNFTGRKPAMIGFALLIGIVLLGVGCQKDTIINNKAYSISGNASGSQMVPVVPGNGNGTITGTYDPSTRVMKYTSNWNNLSGAPTGGNFYSAGRTSYGTRIDNPWVPSNSTGTGTYSDTLTLDSEQAKQLLNGNLYFSFATAIYPNGEIRGQIKATR